ncbi:DUF1640 domain-containing protein [Lamprobacter modestohalophilus]|uniref:DUF1640 domain-containing protein n=1 Tax=Lamprobacter modestohalophilus TaxID=1064514 RepID=UPI002ADEAB20|nr:DUF1640 domain-containing protein [Lamprobacter modestohalophilus]MEA1051982.1 DUF1640 domain-containing protein [Lamprobacter modestohalophilus]
MTTVTLDTHRFIRTLKDACIPESQAEAISETFRAAHIEAELATKPDLQAQELALKAEVRKLEYRLIIKLGGMTTIAIAIVAALVKLL